MYSELVLLQKNDLFLICTDGVTDTLQDAQIESVLCGDDSIIEKGERLKVRVLEHTEDNVSFILCQICSPA